MATRTPNFAAIPAIPQQGVSQIELATLSALKANVELLIGSRGNGRRQAITKEQVDISLAPQQKMRQVSAQGAGFTISGVLVPSSQDYVKLIQDVQQLANDVANLRETLNTLITRMRL